MMLPNNPTIQIFKNANELAQALAVDFQGAVDQAAKENRSLNIALSGGSTPALFFQKLASSPYQRNISWQNVHFFWGDERCVPPDHPDSNYGMTQKNLLDHISIPGENIHRILGENDPVNEANRYAGEIIQWLPVNPHGWPEFDWILLGLGADGHTASIFPGSDVLEDRTNICAVATHPETGQKRITLTLPIINRAKSISFLVTGEDKAEMVAKVLSGNESLPASFVKTDSGILEWHLDEQAGKLMRLI
ncbi:MAG: 6-phosphogluconolactonase [bacterium]|nr:6-phosphogluconolactonase [bacterium]